MQEDQKRVETGLSGLLPTSAATPTPADDVTLADNLYRAHDPDHLPKKPPSPPVNISGLEPDVIHRVEELNQAMDAYRAQTAVHPKSLNSIAPDYDPDTYQRAHDDNLKRDFLEAVGQRNSFNPSGGGGNNPPEYVPPPIPARVAEQTRLEMEAGRRAVAEAEARDKAMAAIRKANQERDAAASGTMKTVFAPDDYVPNMQQGLTATRTNRPMG
jgi:hypothetical protein